MQIDTSQQVSATYARNHFKEVMNKARSEGMQVIIHKSEPSIVVIRLEDLKKIKEQCGSAKKKTRKFDLDFIRKNSHFEKYAGCLDDKFDKNLSSVEISKQWTKYVD